jgi:5,5'-dehydrodivanillate O-demethylase
MGGLLRRHWMPIAGASEFEGKTRIKPVRLMGEDLVLYKDLSDNFGLVERACAHRRADLSYGFVEKCGLRCNYHGWAYDETGQCVEMPYEDTVAAKARYKDKVKILAYPVKEHAGMVWAYLGPLPAPELPDWEPFSWKNGFRQIIISEIPCNWLQCQENSIDPVHFEWMHTNWSRRQADPEAALGPRHMKVGFDSFEYGLIYRRQREDLPLDHSMWSVGRVCLWPNCFFLGDHFEWRVPIDDETTLSIAWVYSRVPTDQEPYEQPRIPAWRGPITDAATGRWISTHVINQDFIAWVGQGAVADRTKEKLGLSDRGILMLRQQLHDDLEAISRGEDPKGLIRDPEVNKAIPLPIADRELLTEGMSLAQWRAHPIYSKHLERFMFQAGQPADVWDAYCEAMGIEGTPPADDRQVIKI